MAPLSLLVSLTALYAGVAAQSSDPTVWAVVAFVMYGERTPLWSTLESTLTPDGAQQMQAQGTAFRVRYLSGNATLNGTDFQITNPAPIHGIEASAIANWELDILTNTDYYVQQGALAFMQGLYPPVEGAFPDAIGGLNISHSAVTGKFVDYPMGGYQYPAIDSLSVLDENSVGLQGHISCTNWDITSTTALREQSNMDNLFNSLEDFYLEVFNSSALQGTIPLTYANFWNAYYLYDLVNYMNIHNQSVHSALSGTPTLTELESLAEELEFAMNANLSIPISTIAGRTLAEKVLTQFSTNQAWAGTEAKLTLMFGSFEPFLAFYALAGLITSATGSEFETFPQPGATMIFELIGDDPDQPGTYPDPDNLKVRFIYRASTNDSAPFLEQSIFGTSNEDQVMSYQDFVSAMSAISVNTADWCNMCDATQPFCVGGQTTSKGGAAATGAKNPAVAGVIGGIITLALVGLAGAAAFLLGGVRLYRDGAGRRQSGLGGFKGAEKMASDADLSVIKSGVHHERIGSWELRDGKAAVTKDFGAKGEDDDAISVIGASPVRPQESV